jgi:hypothetical protein
VLPLPKKREVVDPAGFNPPLRQQHRGAGGRGTAAGLDACVIN